MKTQTMLAAAMAWTFLFTCPLVVHSKDLDTVRLPAPRMEGGKPLMNALKDRMTIRAFSDEKISPQTLSDLLWAAFGINRADGRRTAPSARNRQEIDIYVATSEGLYLYDAAKNALDPVLGEDVRAGTGTQPYVREAPLNLVYVADFAKTGQAGEEDRNFLAAADAGFISENVYLFCASEGLGTVVRASIDTKTLARTMKLRPDQKIILAQSVGYPKK